MMMSTLQGLYWVQGNLWFGKPSSIPFISNVKLPSAITAAVLSLIWIYIFVPLFPISHHVFSLQFANRLVYHDDQYFDGQVLASPEWLSKLADILNQMNVSVMLDPYLNLTAQRWKG